MKIKISQNNVKLLSLAIILVVGLVIARPAAASVITTVVTTILGVIISGLGLILVLAISALVQIASFQHFIDAEAVKLGWDIVRDICNMFFVIVLLVIAFGTILNIEAYSYKKWLPKLILFAVLINFSKTICGLLIDVSQIVMLTFVNAFKDIGSGNFVDAFQVTEIFQLDPRTGETGKAEVSDWEIVGAYLLGIVYMLVAIVVVVTMLMMLAMRVVMIWIYVVLSPAAYLLAAFPGGQRFSSMWWSEFVKNLVVGPVVAFFIWLSLASLTADTTIQSFQNEAAQKNFDTELATVGTGNFSGDDPVAPNTASKPSVLIRFVVAIGMLVGGLMVAQQIGGASGSMAGKGMTRLQKGAAFAGGMAVGAITKPTKAAITGSAGYAADKLHQKTGVDLNLKRVWGGVQEKRKEIQKKRYAEGQVAAGKAMQEGGTVRGMLAMTGNPGDAWEQMTSLRGIKKRIKGGKRMSRDLEQARRDKADAKNEHEDLEQASFREEWVKASPDKRSEMLAKMDQERQANEKGRDTARENIAEMDQELSNPNITEPQAEAARILKAEEEKRLADFEAKIKSQTSLQDKLKFEDEWLKKDGASREAELNTISPVGLYRKRDDARKAKDNEQKNLSDTNKKLKEEQKKANPDQEKIANLEQLKSKQQADLADLSQKEKDANAKIAFAKKHRKGDDNTYSQDEISKAEADRKKVAGKYDEKEIDKRISANTSENYFATRDAENKLVASEMKKLENIESPDDLLIILQDAINKKDKTLVKAISLKMAKSGQETAILQNFGGEANFKGLQSFVRQLVSRSGFNEQEAFGLGSQISEMSKSTNHWSTAGAYVAENGRWREASEDEHLKIRNTGVQKINEEEFISKAGHLAYGSTDKNGNFKIDVGGYIKLKSMDSAQGHTSINKKMNENVIKQLYKAIKSNQRLEEEFSKASQGNKLSLLSVLENRLAAFNNKEDNFDEKISRAKDMGL